MNKKFSDIPNYLLNEYFNEVVDSIWASGETETEYAEISKSILSSSNKTIIADGGYWTTFYIKNDEEFLQVKLVPTSPVVDGNFLNFDRGDAKSMITTPSSAAKWEPGAEIYFRNDSYFHEWWNKKDTDSASFINKNKFFTYIGKIYKTNEFTDDGNNAKSCAYAEKRYGKTNAHWHIEIVSMKDWSNNALPEHQVTNRIQELFTLYFDKVYMEIHNKVKDLWSLLDPLEGPYEYLWLMAAMYGVSLYDNLSISTKREYIRDVIHFLKRKGTYTSLYIIWYLLTLGTINRFNVYERWHDWNVIGNPTKYFEDNMYQAFYGVRSNVTGSETSHGAGKTISGNLIDLTGKTIKTGDSFYDYWYVVDDYPEYNRPTKSSSVSASKQLSPHYRAELDLSDEPLNYNEVDNTQTKIISKNMIEALLDGWNTTKPVSKYANYNYLMGINAEFTSSPVELYSSPYQDVGETLFTGTLGETTYLSGTVIHEQSATSDTWTITHNLNSKKLIVNCYNQIYEMIEPLSITQIDLNTLKIQFSVPVAGICVILDAQIGINATEEIRHNLGSTDIIFQGVDDNNTVVEMLNVKSDSVNVMTMDPPQPDKVYRALFTTKDYSNDVITGSSSPYTATVNHGLGSTDLFVVAYDFNTYAKIDLSSIKYIDADNILVETSSPSKHIVVVVKKASNISSFSSTDSITIPHNLGKTPLVAIWNTTTSEMIQDATIDTDKDGNTTTVILQSAASGKVIYMLPDVEMWLDAWLITHSLNEQYVLSQNYTNDVSIRPREKILRDVNNMVVVYSRTNALSGGFVSVEEYDYIHWQDNGIVQDRVDYDPGPPEIKGRSKTGQGAAKVWEIEHNLGYTINLIEFFDIYHNKIYPQSVTIVNENKMLATFAEAQLGYALLRIIGNISLNKTTALSISKYKIGSGTTDNFDAQSNNDLENVETEGPIVGFREDDTHFYLDAFDTTYKDINITEVGLFDTSDNLVFYTKMKLMYKPKDVDTTWHWKIKKL